MGDRRGTGFDRSADGSNPFEEYVVTDRRSTTTSALVRRMIPNEAPDTPTDEPKPAPVQDPPAEPDRAPYVVRWSDGTATLRVEP